MTQTQPGAGAGADDPKPDPRRVSGWSTLVELIALCGLVVTQPLLDVIGRSPDFFFFHGAGPAAVLALVAVIVLVPPVLLWGLGWLIGLAGPAVRRWTHLIVLGGLTVLLMVQIAKALIDVRGPLLVLLAAVAATVLLAGYVRSTVARQVLRVAAVGPLAFVSLFVFASPSSAVLLGRETSGAPVRSIGPHPPVVVIILDEFPLVSLLDERGEIDAGLVPNFAQLAAGSTWYRNATTVSGKTVNAVPAMLTGRYPTGELTPHYSQHPDNLFTLLGPAYQVEAWENVTQLCPPQHCRGRPGQDRGSLPVMLRETAALYGQLISPDDSLDDPAASFREPTVADDIRANDKSPDAGPGFRMSRLKENQPARFTEFLGSLRPRDTPTLHFLHLLMPHSPWTYLPSGMRYDGPGGLPYDGPWWARLTHQRHLQQVGYTDLLVGEALRTLRANGLYDDALIVVTSDHGGSFSEGVAGREMDDQFAAAAELAWVPLFVKEPGQQAGRIDDRNWEQVDLLPTVADHAGVQVPWRTDGISALRGERETTDKRFDPRPGEPVTIDGPAHFAAVQAGSSARPVFPPLPAADLIGVAVDDLTVVDTGPPATVTNLSEYQDVRAERGKIPALVHGTLPESVPVGAPVAVALNGQVGTVVQAARDGAGQLRFVGLIPDERLFVAGANRLELFLVVDAEHAGDGPTATAPTLRRLPTTG
ncbi:sulfatase-like hydrolase/transferase [Solwaraspora sp. WMMA2080]|uniref:sulfatase-like hydrolase/transferase n=1 Tax=unclassified Solwaraspora TaxID=2627926 RepID=UPI00248AC1D1|nr:MULTISPECIES: sulfatase-like hydrolase/transferase [unclassified Solwaraspora]WBB98974.1 sulfatase-like hydrolase/transferase [Solwaraspora sp. WMMA2059]WBC22473.1 sulfatase-like hydrolase/transferase [Solwaraspora sp. WMMA2080]